MASRYNNGNVKRDFVVHYITPLECLSFLYFSFVIAKLSLFAILQCFSFLKDGKYLGKVKRFHANFPLLPFFMLIYVRPLESVLTEIRCYKTSGGIDFL